MKNMNCPLFCLRVQRTFVLFLLMLSIGAKAQLTQAVMPSVGDSIIYFRATNPGFYFNGMGQGGSNQVWSFPHLYPVSFDTVRFTSPAVSSFAGSFPTANYRINPSHDQFFQLFNIENFFNLNSSGLYQNGLTLVPPSGFKIPGAFNSELTYLQFPFNLGDHFRDTASLTIQVAGSDAGFPVDSIRYKHSIWRNDSIDASGSLSLFAHYYPNVLRKKTRQQVIDSLWIYNSGNWNFDHVESGSQTDFTWWAAGEKFMLLEGAGQGDTPNVYVVKATGMHNKLAFSNGPLELVKGQKLPALNVTCRKLNNGQINTAYNDSTQLIWGSANNPYGAIVYTANQPAVNGQVQFNFSQLNYNITNTDTGQYYLLATGDTIVPDTLLVHLHAPVGKLHFNNIADTVLANTIVPAFTLQARYISNNQLIASFNDTVFINSNINPSFSGAYAVKTVNGIATYNNLVFTQPGTYTLYATADTLYSDTFTITVLQSATKLKFNNAPVSINNYTTAPAFTVKAINRYTNAVITSFTDTVKLSTIPTGLPSVIGGTMVPAINGISTFNSVQFTDSGLCYLIASATGAEPDTTIVTVYGSPDKLKAISPPLSVAANAAFTINVEARRADNSLATNYSAQPARIGKLSGPGFISGNLAVTITNGVAQLNNLRLSYPGSYQLILFNQTLAPDTIGITVTAPYPSLPNFHRDTLSEFVDRASAFGWMANADGYLSGSGRGSFTEIFQIFDMYQTATITDVDLYISSTEIIGAADSFLVKIYNAGVENAGGLVQKAWEDSLPRNFLGSQKFCTSDLHVTSYGSGNPSVIHFNNPVPVHAPFIVSLELNNPTANDTIVLWTSVGNDGHNEQRTGRLWTYSAPSHWLKDADWRNDFNIDFMVAAKVYYGDTSLVVNAGKDDTICSGTRITLGNTNLAYGGTPPYAYLWQPATGLNCTTCPHPSFTPANTASYILRVQDALGAFRYDTVNITVNPTPVADAGPTRYIQTGGTVQLGGTPTASAGTAPYTYSWSPFNLNNNNAANPITSALFNNQYYYVTVTDARHCSATDSVLVQVGTFPLQANAGADTIICRGQTTTIGGNPSANGGTTPYTYTWSPSTGIDCATCPNPVFTDTTNRTYILQVTGADNNTVRDTVSVTVAAVPVIQITGDSVACQQTQIHLTATGAVHYQWLPSGLVNNDTLVAITFMAYQNIRVIVQGTSMYGCKNNDTIDIQVKPLPVADFSTSVTDQTVTCTNQSQYQLSQLWNFGGVTDTAFNAAHTYQLNGIYPVVLIATNSCGADTLSKNVIINYVGINEPADAAAVSLAPVPAIGSVTITNNTLQTFTATLYDVNGRVMLDNLSIAPGLANIPLSNLAAGIYTVSFKGLAQHFTKRMVVAEH